ncbi:MAG: hypothetical protein OEX02_07180 [Cyclobacteriaceae bacterium]|nr:hypothetical protein [Cyclobacteriaceae bacterium]
MWSLFIFGVAITISSCCSGDHCDDEYAEEVMIYTELMTGEYVMDSVFYNGGDVTDDWTGFVLVIEKDDYYTVNALCPGPWRTKGIWGFDGDQWSGYRSLKLDFNFKVAVSEDYRVMEFDFDDAIHIGYCEGAAKGHYRFVFQ